jgi:hypothetical protein
MKLKKHFSSNIIATIISLLLFLISLIPTYSQYSQLGDKIVGTGAVNGTSGASQGSSVSISYDGKTMAVGGYEDNSNTGAVWIYTLTGSNWQQLGQKLVGIGAVGQSYQGFSISLSGDGKTLAVGGFGDNSNIGAVWVYTLSGGNWVQVGDKLVGAGYVGASYQGWAVSLSSDGKTLAFSGKNDNSGAGAVWVYTFSNNNWTQSGTKIVSNGFSGNSVSISSNGDILAIGGGNSIYPAQIWVYTFSGGNWNQLGNTLNGLSDYNYLGGSVVSLSASGNLLAIGNPYDTLTIGSVSVYTFTGINYVQMGKKLIGTGVGAGYQPYEGWSVSLSPDGHTLAFGGENDNNGQGAVWVYTLSGINWVSLGNKLIAEGSFGEARQGWSVCLSKDGSTLAFSGDLDNNSSGAVWVFTSTGWSPRNNDSTTTSGGTGNPKSDTLSIQGTIYQGATPLSSGVVIGIDLNSNKTYSSIVTNGKFDLDSLPKSNYIVYAIPNPVSVSNYLPTYYYNTIDVSKAIILQLKGHIFGVNINLIPITTTITGTYTITGRFSYDDNSSDTGTAYNNNWFGISNQPANAIPVTGNVVKNLPVFLYNTEGQLLASTITDTSGYFVFANIPAGNYEILGQRNGYTTENDGLTNVGSLPNQIVSLQLVSAVTGLQNELISSNATNVHVYPNPFNEEITLFGYTGNVTVYDLTGSVYLQTTIQDKEPIQTSNWPSGFYLLKARNKVQKIIKQ